MSQLGIKVRELRKKAGHTLESFSKLSGCSKSYVWGVENSKTPKPSADHVLRMAKVLNVTMEFLVDDSCNEMTGVIPSFLKEMSQQINTQDNRCTADPIWMVCCDERQLTMEGYEQFIEYGVSDGDFDVVFSTEDDSLANNEFAIVYFLESYPEYVEKWTESTGEEFDEFDFMDAWNNYGSKFPSMPEGIEAYYSERKMKVIRACLTESDAKYFIKRKQHDYPRLYTYVFSMYHCPQMIQLREWIMGLTRTE